MATTVQGPGLLGGALSAQLMVQEVANGPYTASGSPVTATAYVGTNWSLSLAATIGSSSPEYWQISFRQNTSGPSSLIVYNVQVPYSGGPYLVGSSELAAAVAYELNGASTIRATAGSPTLLSTDQTGDFAIDTAPSGAGVEIYGPLTGGVWPSGIPLASTSSPVFTGNPTGPTPAFGDSSQSFATTAFVQESGFTTPNIWLPSDDSLLSEAFDYALAGSNYAVTPGNVVMVRLILRVAATISNVGFIYAAGATSGASGTYVAVYGVTGGSPLAVSADLSTAFSTTGGLKIGALTEPYVAAAGQYFAAYLVNSASTAPQLGRNGALAEVNFTRTGNSSRFATGQTGNTTTTPGSYTTASALSDAVWAAFS